MEHLPPIPGLIRRDPGHQYWLNGRPFAVSVTGVLQVQKSDYAMARIQATQDIWAPRGRETHRALELFLVDRFNLPLDSAGDSPAESREELQALRTGDYAKWIEPLMALPLWEQVRVIASERATCCVRRGVAGTYDLAYDGARGRGLADLKTLGASSIRWRRGGGQWNDLVQVASEVADVRVEGGAVQCRSVNSGTWFDLLPLAEAPWQQHEKVELKASRPSTYCTRAQLGGYMALEATHGHHYDYGQTLWARPGRTTPSELYSRSECLAAWAAVWTWWQARQGV